MGKITEGPWMQVCEGYNFLIESEELEICLVYGEEDTPADADARLISKAPEMLGLLKALAYPSDNGMALKVAINEAKALITEIECQ